MSIIRHQQNLIFNNCNLASEVDKMYAQLDKEHHLMRQSLDEQIVITLESGLREAIQDHPDVPEDILAFAGQRTYNHRPSPIPETEKKEEVIEPLISHRQPTVRKQKRRTVKKLFLTSNPSELRSNVENSHVVYDLSTPEPPPRAPTPLVDNRAVCRTTCQSTPMPQ